MVRASTSRARAGQAASFFTKVDAIDGTLKIITLHIAATAAVSAVNVRHDDQAAIQAAIQAAFDNHGGTIIVGPGFYRLNGPLNSIGSLLMLPYTDLEPATAISIVGTVGPYWPNFLGGVTPYGAIFQTDVVAPMGAILRANNFDPGPGNPVGHCNNISLTLNLTFRTYNDQQISGIDMGVVANFFTKYVTVDAGVAMYDGLEPTNSNVYGVGAQETQWVRLVTSTP